MDVPAIILAIAGADYSGLRGRNLLVPYSADQPAFGRRSSILAKDGRDGVLEERWIRMVDWKLVDMENSDTILASTPKRKRITAYELNMHWCWLNVD